MGLAIKRICVAPLAGNLDMVVYLAPWINYNGLFFHGLLMIFQNFQFFEAHRHQVEGQTALRVVFPCFVGVVFEFCREPQIKFLFCVFV